MWCRRCFRPAVLDAVFTSIAEGDEKAVWRLTRGRVLVAIFDTAFAKLTDYGVDKTSLGKLRDALKEAGKELEAGGRFSVDAFADDLENRLAA